MEWVDKSKLGKPLVLARWEPLYGNDQCIFYDDEGFLCQISKNEALEIDGAQVIVPESRILNGPSYIVPAMVQIKITNACNFHCHGCYAESGKRGVKEMSIKQIEDLLDRLAKWGVLTVQWVGGEVFLKNGFENLVAHAYELGFQQYLLTNGSIFGQKPENFSREAWGYFFSIQVSVDGIAASFDQHVRRQGSWQIVKKGIQNLGKTKPNFCKLKIATISTKKLIPKIELVGEELSKIEGIDFWKLGKEISSGRSKITEQESLQSQIKIWRRVRGLSLPFVIQTYFDKETTPEKLPPELFDDPGARDFMYILHNGDVYPRPLMTEWRQFCGGNCLTTSLKDIWYSKNFQAVRSITRKDTGCGDCKLTCTQRGLDQRLNLFNNGINLRARPLSHPGCKIQ